MKIKLMILSLVLLLVGCTASTPSKQEKMTNVINHENSLSVHFINVGQGDAILIQSPQGKNMLIDGGPKQAGKEVVSYLRAQGVNTLDYVVATHPDADHIGGLISVLNSISIKQVIDSGKAHTSQTYIKMLELINEKNISYKVPQTGDQLSLDDQVEVNVLHASENADANNEASIVLKVSFGEVSFLLTGDADVKLEKTIMDQFNVQSTILKAGHHGSNTSSSLKFLKAVKPEATILSYGQGNKYGHPHAEIVDRLREVGSAIYSTAEAGDLVIRTDGKKYTINNSQSNAPLSPSTEDESATVVITSKDDKEELVGITNNGAETVNLKGWTLVSVEGDQRFIFPDVTILSGQTIYVQSGAESQTEKGYLFWTKRSVWKDAGDSAQLLNPEGVLISEFD